MIKLKSILNIWQVALMSPRKKSVQKFKTSYFTLLEMIVAIAIFACVIGVAGMSLVSVRKAWQKVYDNSQLLENLLKIDRVVDTCFRNIVPMHWQDEQTKKDRTIFNGQEDSVFFATKHRITGADFSAIRFVKLYQDDDKLIAEYRKTPILSWDENELGLKKEVLATNIERITFLYGDVQSTNEKDRNINWNSTWEEEKPLNYMPLAIQMTVEWKDGEKEQWLRRTAGSGMFETLGKRKKPKIKEGNEDEKPNTK